jgi:hypothetical protein
VVITSRCYSVLMSNSILLAVITGLATGAASGWLTSSWHIRRTVTTQAKSGGQAQVGNRNLEGSGAAQVASAKGRASILQTTVARERPAQLSATVERSSDPGLPRQVLVLRNLGERPVEELVVAAAPDGGAFLAQPNWATFPSRLAGGDHVAVPCSTTGAGLVKLTAQYVADGALTGPILLEATHRADHSM